MDNTRTSFRWERVSDISMAGMLQVRQYGKRLAQPGTTLLTQEEIGHPGLVNPGKGGVLDASYFAYLARMGKLGNQPTRVRRECVP